MKLIGRQIVVELPTEAKGYSGQEKWMKGWNQCLAASAMIILAVAIQSCGMGGAR